MGRYLRVVEKGGDGSGSWNGPGDPRFSKADSAESSAKEAVAHTKEATGGKGPLYDQSVTAQTASSQAAGASRIAERSGTKEDHIQASRSHRDAAEVQDESRRIIHGARFGAQDAKDSQLRDAKDSAAAARDYHISTSEYHAKKASESASAVKPRKRGSDPYITASEEEYNRQYRMREAEEANRNALPAIQGVHDPRLSSPGSPRRVKSLDQDPSVTVIKEAK